MNLPSLQVTALSLRTHNNKHYNSHNILLKATCFRITQMHIVVVVHHCPSLKPQITRVGNHTPAFTGCKSESGTINNIVQQCFSSVMYPLSYTSMKLKNRCVLHNCAILKCKFCVEVRGIGVWFVALKETNPKNKIKSCFFLLLVSQWLSNGPQWPF